MIRHGRLKILFPKAGILPISLLYLSPNSCIVEDRKHTEGGSALRIMAVDYGDAHTGVAISDPTGLLAGTTLTIHSRREEEVLARLKQLAEEYQVDEIVMGFPRNMDGTEGPRAELYRAFAQKLEEASGRRPVLWDERRTTIDAHRILFDAGKNAKKRKKTVDAVAASLILEGYLTFRRTRRETI